MSENGKPSIEDVIRSLIAVKLSVSFCEELAQAELTCLKNGYMDLADELAQAHEHIHAAIRLCTKDDGDVGRKVSAGMEAEKVAILKAWDDFIQERKEAGF